MSVRDHGFALILVLVAVVGVFALALQGAVMSRSATIEARVLRERMEGERTARSAAAVVLMALNRRGGVAGDASGSGFGQEEGGSGAAPEEEPRLELPPIIREILGAKADELEKQARDQAAPQVSDQGGSSSGGSGRTGRGGGAQGGGIAVPSRPVDVSLREGVVCRVSLSDASGGLNVNTASEEEIRRYFQLKIADPLLAAAVADELLDWRDEDDFVRPRGAERSGYSRREIVVRNGRLESREELRFLPSMTEELYDAIRRDLVLDGDGRIHAASASREVLASVEGMSVEAADEIVRLRSRESLTPEGLKSAMPLAVRESLERLKLEPSGLIHVQVEVRRESENGLLRYEGLAVMGAGGVRAIGLKPL